MRATLDHLTKPTVEHGTVTVDGLEFVIRPLSRRQQLEVHERRDTVSIAAADALLLHYGLVDPALSLEQAEAWQDTEGQGDVAARVSQGIGVISGLLEDSGKAAYKSVR
jgi:hypothetical protein